MASTDTLAVGHAPRRRRARLLSLLVTALAVATGAWFVLRRRAPALPAFSAEAQPGPSTTARPASARPRAVADQPVRPVQPVEPVEPGEPVRPVEPVQPVGLVRPDEPVQPLEPVQPATGPLERTATPPVPAAPPPLGDPGGRPVPPAPSSASEELQRVSGIGRRSAEALVAAGIDSLDRLAGSDDATVVAALEAAGLRRSPTLSAWASQARRLTRT